ncbi:MAG: ferredoxin-type protein NapF [Sulfurospirillum sp.]
MIQKRELFGSLVSSFKRGGQKSETIIRPPYFSDVESFLENCIECNGVCENFCQEKIIVIKEDKTPVLDFSKGGCTYCDECAKACEFGVLDIKNKRSIKAKITINVLECLSWDKTMCFSCKDVCMEDAIVYLGLFRPEIDMDICTNCGFCVNVCPTQAIKVKKWQ